MSSDAEWIGLDALDPVTLAGDPDMAITPLVPANRPFFRRLRRVASDWTVIERAHDPFSFAVKRRTRTFRPSGKPLRNHEFEVFSAPPPHWDWREQAAIASPLDQKQCNCCSAFAIAAIMTDLASIRAGSARAPLSPGHLHWCIGGATCPTAIAPDFLAAAAVQRAVAMMQPGDFPFNPATCPTAQGVGRLAGVRSLFTANDAVEALRGGPILTVMDLYDDFWSHYGGGVYRRRSQRYLNAHTIAIVGYDAPQQCWFVKNSEGAGWGEGGYARIAFGECRIFTNGGHGGLALQLA